MLLKVRVGPEGGPVMVEWLHRVITVVWRSGTCPPDWKKGSRVSLQSYIRKGAVKTVTTIVALLYSASLEKSMT